ncbi:hypothetical protein [Streptomyces sp. NPDC050164]|uniref:hypothetical protein n=1 Tax=Streptomyces sp. NPDC050164 TaxID=3365605 RepID=UPI0037B8ADD9
MMAMADHTHARALHIVAPDSLRTWFRHFVHDPDGLDQILYADADSPLPLDHLLRRLDAVGSALVVFHSSHETLLRDSALAAELSRRGHAVLAQSPVAARLGVDKCLMRELFERHGLSALPWWRHHEARAASADAVVVVKARGGTQSRGTRLALLRSANPSADEFCELYADGTEYSVLVYRDDSKEAVLPPVWKGPTSRRLVPPWRRLRLCPDPFGGQQLDRKLRDWGLRTAVAAQSTGWTEVELLVTGEGTVHVLEINPRVSGTLRIAALAAQVLPFSLHRAPAVRGQVPPVRHAAEVPYTGPGVADADRAVFGTSRLTVAAPTYGELLAKLGHAADEHVQAVLAPFVAGDSRARRSVAPVVPKR